MGGNSNVVYDNKNPEPVQLAHGYFPSQQLNEVCITIKCLGDGTIFPELDMPYSSNIKNIYDNKMS